MGARRQVVQPVAAGFLLRRLQVFRHGDGERFVAVEPAVVVDVDIHLDSRQARFARIAHTVAVEVDPLGAVDRLVGRFSRFAVAEVDVVALFRHPELDLVSAPEWQCLLAAGRHHFDELVGAGLQAGEAIGTVDAGAGPGVH